MAEMSWVHDPFGRTRLPPGLATQVDQDAQKRAEREHRVALLAQASEDLLEGRLPPPAARLLLAGAVASWLQGGGDLVRDYLKVGAPRGSHETAAALLRQLRDSDPSSR